MGNEPYKKKIRRTHPAKDSFTQSGTPAESAGRSIKRTVQLRNQGPNGGNWESSVSGQTCHGQDTRRSPNDREKTNACGEAKGKGTRKGPGVRPMARGERVREIGPEIQASPWNSEPW